VSIVVTRERDSEREDKLICTAAKARPMYREHNRLVRSVVPADRLLDYKMSDGWEPLCRFLGKDIPETPFPTKHGRGDVSTRYRWIRIHGLKVVSIKLIKLGVPLLAGWLLYQYLAVPKA
jgi:hypothetical protein